MGLKREIMNQNLKNLQEKQQRQKAKMYETLKRISVKVRRYKTLGIPKEKLTY